ncbi:hypothetical protein MHYP_G00286560 [Metynnis hypsauchen]
MCESNQEFMVIYCRPQTNSFKFYFRPLDSKRIVDHCWPADGRAGVMIQFYLLARSPHHRMLPSWEGEGWHT